MTAALLAWRRWQENAFWGSWLPRKWFFSFSGSLVSMCRLGQTSTMTLRGRILYVLFAGSIHMGQGIWGLLSSKLDNPAHKYSSHSACFYIWITKGINAQMPLRLPRHQQEKVGRLQIQGWHLACATNYEAVAEHQNPEGTTFLPIQHPSPTPVISYHSHYHTYPVSPLIFLLTFTIFMKFVILFIHSFYSINNVKFSVKFLFILFF